MPLRTCDCPPEWSTPLRSSARTVYPLPAAGLRSLWHPCHGRSGESRWWVADQRWPQAHLHSCDGRSTSFTLVQTWRIWLAGTVYESLAMWPIRPSLHLRTMNQTSSKPLWWITSSLKTKSCQLMCKMHHWHCIWKESSLFKSVCVRVQVAEP